MKKSYLVALHPVRVEVDVEHAQSAWPGLSEHEAIQESIEGALNAVREEAWAGTVEFAHEDRDDDDDGGPIVAGFAELPGDLEYSNIRT